MVKKFFNVNYLIKNILFLLKNKVPKILCNKWYIIILKFLFLQTTHAINKIKCKWIYFYASNILKHEEKEWNEIISLYLCQFNEFILEFF